jgi:hypothetical protein
VAISIAPANEASCDDLAANFGTRGETAGCWCQRYKLQAREAFKHFPPAVRAERLRRQTNCGHADASTTSGLAAYLGGEPVGWCAVEPRTAYEGPAARLPRALAGPHGGQADDSVWAVPCLLACAGYRRRGIGRRARGSAF